MTSCTDILTSLGLGTPSETTRMSGFDATVWRAVVNGRPLAVRMLRPGRDADDEVRALRLAAAATPLAPSLVATGRHDGCGVIVMSWCDGRPIPDVLREGGDAVRLGHAFGAAQARLNASGVCHLDYQPGNVLTDGGTVTGIVDWSLARRGDTRLDVAQTRVILEFAPALVTDLPVAELAAAWARGYASIAPLPGDDELAPFLARAAERQRLDWQRRVDAGEVAPELAAAATAVAQRHPAHGG